MRRVVQSRAGTVLAFVLGLVIATAGTATAAKLITSYGSLEALREAVDRGDPAIKGAQRRNLESAARYLDVGPLVVKAL